MQGGHALVRRRTHHSKERSHRIEQSDTTVWRYLASVDDFEIQYSRFQASVEL